jgi:hypothetical protein
MLLRQHAQEMQQKFNELHGEDYQEKMRRRLKPHLYQAEAKAE